MLSSSSTVSYAAAAAATASGPRPQSPAKYVPVHRRRSESPSKDSNAASRRSPSPTPSDVSAATLVGSEVPSTKPRVYSIDTLLHLGQDPEIKLISVVQKDRLRETMPEIVMNRKMRKALEYHAIQERIRARAQVQAQHHDDTAHPPHPNPVPDTPTAKLSIQQQRQRLVVRRQGRSIVERRRNLTKVVEDANWRAFAIQSLASV